MPFPTPCAAFPAVRFHAILKALALLAIATGLLAPTAAQQPALVAPDQRVSGEALTGTWQGTLRIGAIELRLVFGFKEDETGKLGGTLTSIDQSPQPIPLSAVQVADGKITASIAAIGAEFSGKMNADKNAIEGEFSQAGATFKLVLKRVSKAPKINRPQEPKPPFPYQSEDVTFENPAAELTLAGTLTTPKGAGPHPAVVLISGSGPQDRDEAILGHKPFAVVADHLTRCGVAVLRYDDRGVGKSTGDFGRATHFDFVTDALAAVDWLKTRPEIDAKQIGLVGHSEGGLVGPLAAVDRPDDIAFVVMLAGVGVPMRELLAQQGQDIGRTMGLPNKMLDRDPEEEEQFYQILRNEEELPIEELKQKLTQVTESNMEDFSDEERESLGITPDQIKAKVETMVTPWFLTLALYDPGPTLERLRCPVLAINGDLDVQVAADANLSAIRTAVERGGNPDVTTVKLEGLNHLFQECETGAIAEYARIEQTFAPAALDAISDWVLKHVEVEPAE